MKPYAFNYHTPETVAEACAIMAGLGDDSAFIAGGTDLVVKLKKGLVRFSDLVSLGKIDELKGIERRADGWSFGAATPLSALEFHPGLKEELPVLSYAASEIGSSTLRNLATIGGNICNAAPSADMIPPLIALDARVVVSNGSSSREIPLVDFFLAKGRVDVNKGELMTEVVVPHPADDVRVTYLFQTHRRAMDVATVGVAGALKVDQDGLCRDARIVLGAVSPVIGRSKAAEELLIGKRVDDLPLDQVCAAARDSVQPITDIRATKEYRSEMIAVLTERVIKKLVNQ